MSTNINISEPKDTSWLRLSFMARQDGINMNNATRYRRSNGWLKFMDTTLGGNTAINAPYQFTRFADIREQRLLKVGRGMGRWYSENIDDWGTNLHIRAGVPAYNSVINYLSNAIDPLVALYASTGKQPTWMAAVGVLGAAFFSIAFWEITALAMFLGTVNALNDGTRFYYLRPTMYAYWATVQTLIDGISANLGLSAESVKGSDGKVTYKGYSAMPEWMTRTGGGDTLFSKPPTINAHAVASRAEALNVRVQIELKKKIESMLDGDGRDALRKMSMTKFMEAVNHVYQSNIFNGSNLNLNPEIQYKTITEYIRGLSDDVYELNNNGDITTENDIPPPIHAGDIYKTVESAFSSAASDVGQKASAIGDFLSGTWNSMRNGLSEIIAGDGNDRLGKALIAELRDGHQWISFRTSNGLDSVSESVSNSLETAGIFGTINEWSDKAREFWFNTAGGNFGLGPIDDLVQTTVSGISEGIAAMVSTAPALKIFSPIAGILNGAKIIEPKRWSSSSTTMSSANFRFELRTPYGNTVSYLQDIIFPLCCLMALAFPRGAGAQSYAAPFFIQYYYKGRSQAKIGIVSSITITRGVGTKPWSKAGLPLGVDVDLTIESVDDMLFVPMNAGLLDTAKRVLNPIEENAMGDYMAVLSGLGLNEQEYLAPKMKRRLGAMYNAFNTMINPYTWSSYATTSFPGQIFSKLADATSVRN